ncbi:glucose-1-phosphate adenylyltransferase subunit GlgD [Paraliobacillus quinghaiensis]|uniref:Glucose-1-phosphate adenylyltransferase subunit GlgD n=1 Tax=Paraliobacillus quinghaiensis TaxID=470815 RepID=A0A917TE69_9BACI|nr:glucose-1-phosphate adenylyltransferase subunit GlgD [Paraliobacillus quinghaiensis]GGM19041.1 glucose-1-phosphate adenylyltransferase subunit GlgD [Paraliobacillus quinghaiensis]
MKTMMGLINLEPELDLYEELTYFRSGASLPFAGRYRLIDFTLSNMVHSSIQEVAIFAQNKYRSLMDHVGSGAAWDLDRRHGGVFILPPDWNDPTDISKGDLRHFHNNIDYFTRGKSEYVLISGSQFIANTSYDDFFKHHLDQEADVTLLTTSYETLLPEHEKFIKVDTDSDGWVTSLSHDKKKQRLFTGVYVLHRDLLLELVQECIAHYKSNLFMDGIMANLDQLKVQAYHYDGYSAVVNSVDSYYRQNMKLLETENYKKLFLSGNDILTKIGNQAPTIYHSGANSTNSLIATGCEINGEINNSIIFRDVKVAEDAVINNSIIMQHSTVESGVHLDNVIVDKDVIITKDQALQGANGQPFVIPKRKTI